jgi:glycerophosphoryl diester phosphodiesterase
VDRVLVQSFDHAAIARVRTLNREIPVGALVAQAPFDPALLRPEAVSAICPGAHVLTAPLLGEIRGAGLGCYVWTVNEPAQMDRLVEWGVTGIITDRPGLLRARLGRS